MHGQGIYDILILGDGLTLTAVEKLQLCQDTLKGRELLKPKIEFEDGRPKSEGSNPS